MKIKDFLSNIYDKDAYVRVSLNDEECSVFYAKDWEKHPIYEPFHKYDELDGKLAIPSDPAIDIELLVVVL